MNSELLSITDENAILISLEFLESGRILKIGNQETERIVLDIIVKNDITFDRLLDAVRDNLLWKLASFGVDIHEKMAFSTIYRLRMPYRQDYCSKAYSYYKNNAQKEQTEENGGAIAVQMEYQDHLHPEAETPQKAVDLQRNIERLEGKEKRSYYQERKLRRARKALAEALKREAEEEEEPEEKHSEQPQKKADSRNWKEKERDQYLICWCVFKRCYDAYAETQKKHPKLHEVEKIQEGTSCEPAILVGSVNYAKIQDGTMLCDSDQGRIEMVKTCDQKTLKESGFITTTRVVFDPWGWESSGPLFDNTIVCSAFQDKVPDYNIGERHLRKLDSNPIHIISPSDPPQKPQQNILVSLLTPLMMTGTMIATRFLYSGGVSGASMGLMAAGTGLVSVFSILLSVGTRNSEFKRSLGEWQSQYQAYIQRTLNDIQKKQKHDIMELNRMYPPAMNLKQYGPDGKPIVPVGAAEPEDLVSKTLRVEGDIFSRGQEHPDFLSVRIGISTKESELVPSAFEIQGEKKEVLHASVTYNNIGNEQNGAFRINLATRRNEKPDPGDGYLIDLPADVARKYAYLEGAPVMLRLRECGTLGIVFEGEDDFMPFLSKMLLNLCYYHAPDDLQCVLLCPKIEDPMAQERYIQLFKHLPHFRELLGNLSAFAFNHTDAYLIFNKLLEILNGRRGEDGGRYPHILVIVLEEHGLKRHAVSEYLPSFEGEKEKKDRGLSFVFCKHHEENLPKYCGQVIRRSVDVQGKEQWKLLPHVQKISRSTSESGQDDESRYLFIPDRNPPVDALQERKEDISAYFRAYKLLSALHYERIAQGADVPASLDLLELMKMPADATEEELASEIQSEILNFWAGGVQDTTKSLRVPLGKKTDEEIIELDLHEKADGPHMLVAGTTGSGKTETILTFLLTLCANYSPEQVNLLLMDMKGAGFVQRIGEKTNRLPHVVGTVTDISGDETGTGTAYMLKRFLQSMNAEVKKRKRYLKQMGVDSVDGYTAARANLDEHIKKKPELKREELEKLPPLPHLFLIIDEFTELMSFGSDKDGVDFRPHITSLARIGRSLGFHIILISQNIENAITDDIRVNSRARLCLKVATRDASREMIMSDLAASPLMPGNGRAYLFVGNGSRFEYFQSAYSGAKLVKSVLPPIKITLVHPSGRYEPFYPTTEKIPVVLMDAAEVQEAELIDEKGEDKQSSAEHKPEQGTAPVEPKTQSEQAEQEVAQPEKVVPEQTKVATQTAEAMATQRAELATGAGTLQVCDTAAVSSEQLTGSAVQPEGDWHTEEISAQSESEENADSEANTTQLDFLVKQIRACGEEFYNHGGKRPRQIFQQPLESECEYRYDWTQRNEKPYELILGRFDNPEEQIQDDYCIDLLTSNLAVFGTAMSGKTTVIKSLLIRMHQTLRVTEKERIYILDFGNGLSVYQKLPYVTAYFDGTNEENVRRIFRTVEDAYSANLRSEELQGITFVQCDPEKRPPHITFIIDGLNSFLTEELYSGYHDTLQKLARDGLSKGISVVFTAVEPSGDIRKLLPSFHRIIALDMLKDAYADIFGRNVMNPISTEGRGMANTESGIFEFQGYYESVPEEKQVLDSMEENLISYGCGVQVAPEAQQEDNRIVLNRCRQSKLKSFKGELTHETLREYCSQLPNLEHSVLLGLDYYSFQPVVMDYREARAIAIYGGKSSGKTNLLNLLLTWILQKEKDTRLVFWDDLRNSLQDLILPENCRPEQVDSDEALLDKLKKEGYYEATPPGDDRIALYRDEFGPLPPLDEIDLGSDIMDYEVNTQQPEKRERFVLRKNPFTVFVIQSRKPFHLKAGGTSANLINKLAPFISEADRNHPKLFIFSDVPQITEPELRESFNDLITHAFLLNDILRFVRDKGSKSVFGHLDQEELKERFGKCEMGDGFYMDIDKEEDPTKLKILKIPR